MIDLSDFLGDISNWDRYYTVEELHVKAAEAADTYPGVVTLMDLGKSVNGETIDCLKVGDGRFNVFPRKRPGVTLAPGVCRGYYLTPARGYLRQWAEGNTNIESIKGCYIYEYGQMRNPHMFMMIPESTFWYDSRMWDDTPIEDSVGDSLKFAQGVVKDVQGFMLEVWREAVPYLGTKSPFKIMYNEMMEPLIHKQTNVSNPALWFDEKVHTRKATVAEKYAIEGREVSFRMTHLGGLVRVLDAELEQGGNEVVERLRAEVYEKIKLYNSNLHENYKVKLNPIKNNVGTCISALLHSATYAKGRQP